MATTLVNTLSSYTLQITYCILRTVQSKTDKQLSEYDPVVCCSRSRQHTEPIKHLRNKSKEVAQGVEFTNKNDREMFRLCNLHGSEIEDKNTGQNFCNCKLMRQVPAVMCSPMSGNLKHLSCLHHRPQTCSIY